MNRQEIIRNRHIAPESFLGKRYTPSLFGRNGFLKIFSKVYSEFSENFTIKQVSFEQDTFRVTLASMNGDKTFDLQIRDNGGQHMCGGVLCTKHLCLGIHHNPEHKNLLKFLVHFSKKGSDITFSSLLNILANDPKAKREYYQIFWRSKRPPFSTIQDWAHETHKVRFIYPEGVLRNLDQSLELNVAEGHIHHSERECHAIGPDVDFHKELHFFSYPRGFYDHTFDKFFYVSTKEKESLISKNTGGASVFTDLSEDDIVMGRGNTRLSESLDYLIKKAEEQDLKVLTFNCCCVPRIVGDDIQSILEKAQEKVNIPFIFHGQLEKTPFEQKITLLEEYLGKVDTRAIQKIPHSIALFGYHENAYLEKLNEVLKNNSVSLQAILIPTITVELLPKLYQTELFLFSSNKFQEEVFEYPFKSMGVPYITPRYPYGVTNSLAWFTHILSFFGKKYEPGKKENAIIEAYETQVSYVKKKGYQIGIVLVGKWQVETLLNPDYNNNIHIIEFLEEMGFHIDFLVYDELGEFLVVNREKRFTEDDMDHGQIESLLRTSLGNTSTASIHYISEEKELYEKITGLNIDLLYSDIQFEDRTFPLGIGVFDIRVFREGFEGALDTINSLLNLIEMDYYRSYGKYFQ